MRIILASQSPRRAEILRSAGVSFEIMPTGIDETVSPALSPSEAVCEISRRKAEYIADLISDGGAFIISADTVVCTGAALADDACSPDGIRCSDSAYTTGGTCSPDGTYSPSREILLGKPHDKSDACRMLSMLSGKSHFVYTGYSLCLGKKMYTGYQKTEVEFRNLTDDEIRRYVESGEPMDKAGAYGIQEKGALFVKGIHGDYFNVMGLPICDVCLNAERVFGVRLASF